MNNKQYINIINTLFSVAASCCCCCSSCLLPPGGAAAVARFSAQLPAADLNFHRKSARPLLPGRSNMVGTFYMSTRAI